MIERRLTQLDQRADVSMESDTVLPLFAGEASRAIAFRDARAVTLDALLGDVARVAACVPNGSAMINLCEDRYNFIVAYVAALTRGQPVLLPPSRVEQVILEVQVANEGSYRVDDAMIEGAVAQPASRVAVASHIARKQCAMIAYTSGSTGAPKSFPKLWRSVHASTALNAAAIRNALQVSELEPVWLVATVPPQHMYGMELSVLLPLLNRMAVHAGRPLFPADIARALAEVPAPRVLISTPIHLRAIIDSGQNFPEVAAVISATAPLDRALSVAIEKKLGGQLLEMFGSTETCVFARRRTSREEYWRMYEGVSLLPSDEGTEVDAPWFDAPVTLQDVVELRGADEFIVRGRNADMIEVAGKRASLGDLTRRLLAIQGVEDAAVFQPEATESGAIRRVAALVVAPNMTVAQILDQLASCVDPAFVPRPLLLVDALPRNDVGKLPREQLAAALQRSTRR